MGSKVLQPLRVRRTEGFANCPSGSTNAVESAPTPSTLLADSGAVAWAFPVEPEQNSQVFGLEMCDYHYYC
jgi:hypothetical protein